MHTEPPAASSLKNEGDESEVSRADGNRNWTRGCVAKSQWRWLITQCGGREQLQQLLSSEAALGLRGNHESNSDDNNTSVLSNLVGLLLGGEGHDSGGWLWSADTSLRSMAQTALRSVLRIPVLGDALGSRAVAVALARTQIYNQNESTHDSFAISDSCGSVGLRDVWYYFRSVGVDVSQLEDVDETLCNIRAEENKAAQLALEQQALQAATLKKKNIKVKAFTTSKTKTKEKSKKAPKLSKLGKNKKGGKMKGNKLDYVTFDKPSKKSKSKSKGKKVDKGSTKSSSSSSSKQNPDNGVVSDVSRQAKKHMTPAELAVDKIQSLVTVYRQALVILRAIAQHATLPSFIVALPNILEFLRQSLLSTRLSPVYHLVMHTTTAFVANLGCNQPYTVAHAFHSVSGAGDTSISVLIARLAEESALQTDNSEAAAVGMSLKPHKAKKSGSLLCQIRSRAISTHVDLIMRLLEPLFESKTTVSGPQFRCIFPVLDAAIRCDPANATFPKALLILAVHCNPSLRQHQQSVQGTKIKITASNHFVKLRDQMISTILYAVQQQPNAFPKPTEVLMALCMGKLGLSDVQVLCGTGGMRNPDAAVRMAALNALAPTNTDGIVEASTLECETALELFANALWMACYDTDDAIMTKANDAWEANEFEIKDKLASYCSPFLDTTNEHLRGMAADSLSGVLESLQHVQQELIDSLKDRFKMSLQAQIVASKVRQIQVKQRDGSFKLVDDSMHAARVKSQSGGLQIRSISLACFHS